jgi:hypothetical protein
MAKSYIIFRYDDYGKTDRSGVSQYIDQAVLDIFSEKSFPLVIAAIPKPLLLQPDRICLLKQFADTDMGEVALHGWDHGFNPYLFATDGLKSEFRGLSYDAQLQRLLASKNHLETWLDHPVHTFVPPGTVMMRRRYAYARMQGYKSFVPMFMGRFPPC